MCNSSVIRWNAASAIRSTTKLLGSFQLRLAACCICFILVLQYLYSARLSPQYPSQKNIHSGTVWWGSPHIFLLFLCSLRRIQAALQALAIFSPLLALLFGSLLWWPRTAANHHTYLKTTTNRNDGTVQQPTSVLDRFLETRSMLWWLFWHLCICCNHTYTSSPYKVWWRKQRLTDHCADSPLGA